MTITYQKALARKAPKSMPAWHEPKGELPDKSLKAVGFTSGIGSMLIGARSAGFQVKGNIEWRDYYRLVDEEGRNTFIENFPGAFLARGPMDMDLFTEHELKGMDLAMGHPECGFYSRLNTGKNKHTHKTDPGDIPLFLEYVRQYKPRFFVMDDLPGAFAALPMEEYHNLLPEYDLFPEWISNYHYGNPQKFRKRMFMIGALRSEGYTFVSGEKPEWDDWTVLSRIGDIAGQYGVLPNHDEHITEGYSSRFLHMRHRDDRPTWGEVSDFFKEHPPGSNFRYHGPEPGTMKTRPSLGKVRADYPSPVLTGGNPMLHYNTAYPLTIRERARLQGFPDDFVFYGTRYNEKGQWEHNNHNMWMVKQTGKAMPIEFNTYAAQHIGDFIRGRKIKYSDTRQLKHQPLITDAKQKYCRLVGYSNQDGACASCWLQKDCTIHQGLLPESYEDILG